MSDGFDPTATAALLERVKIGDPAAAEALFSRHTGRLRLYVRYRLGRALACTVEVEDVVQETWLRAVAEVSRFEGGGESAFFRYLCLLARHVIADVARTARAQKRSARRVRLDRSGWSRAGVAESAVAASIDGPLTRALLAEESRLIEEAYLSLPAAYRRVIAMRQLEQKPAREVARAIGSTEQAVHAMYRRALSAWAAESERLGVVRAASEK